MNTWGGDVEVLYLAHVLADPGLTLERRIPKLSPAATVVLEIIQESPTAARVALYSSVRVSLRAMRHYSEGTLRAYPSIDVALLRRRRVRYRDVLTLARRIDSMAARELVATPRELMLAAIGARPREKPKRKRKSEVDRILESMGGTAA